VVRVSNGKQIGDCKPDVGFEVFKALAMKSAMLYNPLKVTGRFGEPRYFHFYGWRIIQARNSPTLKMEVMYSYEMSESFNRLKGVISQIK
jgi:hypothetical protein